MSLNSSTIKSLRLRHGLTQDKAAEIVRINKRSWARYESGQKKVPKGLVELFCLKLGESYTRQDTN